MVNNVVHVVRWPLPTSLETFKSLARCWRTRRSYLHPWKGIFEKARLDSFANSFVYFFLIENSWIKKPCSEEKRNQFLSICLRLFVQKKHSLTKTSEQQHLSPTKRMVDSFSFWCGIKTAVLAYHFFVWTHSRISSHSWLVNIKHCNAFGDTRYGSRFENSMRAGYSKTKRNEIRDVCGVSFSIVDMLTLLISQRQFSVAVDLSSRPLHNHPSTWTSEWREKKRENCTRTTSRENRWKKNLNFL